MSQPKSNEEIVKEFDKLYVVHCSDGDILDGMVDAKKVKRWLRATLAQKDAEVAEAVKAERERITAHLNLTRMAQIAKLNGRNDIASVYERLNAELEALTPKE